MRRNESVTFFKTFNENYNDRNFHMKSKDPSIGHILLLKSVAIYQQL